MYECHGMMSCMNVCEYVLMYVVCIYRDWVLGDLSTSIYLWLIYKQWFHEKERKQGDAYTNTQTH